MIQRKLSSPLLVKKSVVAWAAPFFCASAVTMHAEERPYVRLEPTEVTATRFDALVSDVAANVRVIDRSVIENSTASNLVELLRKEGNLRLRSFAANPSNAQVSMRGYGENSGERVLVLLDGHRLNAADLGGIDWMAVPLSLVERVEIIHGAQSALYGNNASAGVIKITTRQPTETPGGEVSAQMGSYDAHNLRGGVTGRTGALGYAVHAEQSETDGYRDNGDLESKGGGVKLDYAFTDTFSAYLSGAVVESDYGLPAGLTKAQYKADPRQTMTPNDRGESESMQLRGGFDYALNESFSVALDGAYSEREVFSDFSGFLYLQDYELVSIMPSATYSTDQFTAVLGVDWMEDKIDVNTDTLNRERVGYFISSQWHITRDWILNVAGRHEENEDQKQHSAGEDSDSGNEYAWSVGLIRKFETARIYGSVSRFYRFPAIDEISIFVPVPSFNPDIDAETGHELELGFEKSFGRWGAGLTAFYQDLQDEVVFDAVNYANTNLDESRRYGAELYIEMALQETLNARLDYTWIDARIKSGENDDEHVPLVSEHQLSFGLDWRPTAAWLLSADAYYVGSYYAAGDFSNKAEKIDGHVLFDLAARYSLNAHTEIFAGVDNLTDEDYVSTATSNGAGLVTAYYPGAGRQVKAGITWRF